MEKPETRAPTNGTRGLQDDKLTGAVLRSFGYHVGGYPPESRPDCGAPREDFESVSIPGF